MMLAICGCRQEDVISYVDPSIGTLNYGNVFVGPCVPFGMVKPGPDCELRSNSGWSGLDVPVRFFSQTHVSGTGGAPKYGNIGLMPFVGQLDSLYHPSMRASERMSLGYYSTEFEGSGIVTEITAGRKTAYYRFTYPAEGQKALTVNAGHCLVGGREGSPSRQRVLASEVSVLSDHSLQGWSTVCGGWNRGAPYTVYFKLETSCSFTVGKSFESAVNLVFPDDAETVGLRLGISFLSTAKAAENLETELSGRSFDELRKSLVDEWSAYLSKVRIDRNSSDSQKRMFYTALYHSALMPVDRTGEWSACDPGETYYDDFYCLWDTYRTSLPLISLLDPERVSAIVNGLLTVYRHDGYLPDGRSGNCNGNTQGGSNADIVIADAFVKGIEGIDYEQALEAMRKDAEVPPEPGRESEAGRGGLQDYLELGYVPYGVPKSGTRTLEYAYCDHAVAVVAEGLGYKELADKYFRRSCNWRNIFDGTYEFDGMNGFVRPKDRNGAWVERDDTLSLTFTPDKSFAKGWGRFYYEANAYEMSFFAPHDVAALIELMGGREAFLERLDRFFDEGCFDVGNEPSFLTSSLYHWAGRPDKTSSRVLGIIDRCFGDGPDGLPGNDDSGAMSSWLAFHMMGLYPVAGHDIYLIHTPAVSSCSIDVGGGKRFRVKTRSLSDTDRYIVGAELNGRDYPYSTLRHSDLVAGGTLVLEMGPEPSAWGAELSETPISRLK